MFKSNQTFLDLCTLGHFLQSARPKMDKTLANSNLNWQTLIKELHILMFSEPTYTL